MAKSESKLVFNWRYKDYGLEAVPQRLVKMYPDEPNVTVDFVKYFDGDKKDSLKYSIGYFWYNERESRWELKFVGDRFMDVVPEDLPALWEGLKSAYTVLTLWKQQNENL